jgi:hypothetical protein
MSNKNDEVRRCWFTILETVLVYTFQSTFKSLKFPNVDPLRHETQDTTTVGLTCNERRSDDAAGEATTQAPVSDGRFYHHDGKPNRQDKARILADGRDLEGGVRLDELRSFNAAVRCLDDGRVLEPSESSTASAAATDSSVERSSMNRWFLSLAR